MLGRLRAGAKFFALGLSVGILFAPQAGAELRERLVARLLEIAPGPLRRE